MATLLYRIGRFSYRRRGVVGTIWLLVMALAGVGAATLSGPTADSFSIPGTESQRAFDLLEERFPGSSADGAAARVVFAAPDGESITDPEHQATIGEAIAAVEAGPQVASVVDPFQAELVSPDGSVALAEVTYAVDFFSLEERTRETLHDAADTARASGLTVELAGTAVEQEPELGSELIGLGVAALVLIITFGSLVAAGMPLLTGVVGVGIGAALITAATGFVDIGSITPILAVMLGLAVGIDYALFIASRYRHELLIGRSGDDAAGRAIGTAGTAVVFAGLTVVIALSGLTVVGIPVLTEMGLAAAATVAIAVVIALTLLPALFGFAGRRFLTVRVPGLRVHDSEADDGRPTWSRRWVGLVTRRPVAVLAVAVVGLGVLALPATDLRLGVPDEGTYPPDSTQRKAYDLTADGFGPGFNGPLLVVVDMADSGADGQSAAEEVAAALTETSGVELVAPPQLDEDGRTAVVTVVPSSGPGSADTERLVEAIRTGLDAPNGATVLVTGMTALFIDFSERVGDALLPYLLVVVGLSFLLLMLAFRSLVVPLKATLGFLLTMAVSFGALVAVFQWGWLTGLLGVEETGLINSMLPIFIIGVVFGLAMDYEVFLVTRMREAYVHGEPARQAVETGFRHGARVVTAAAVIMISVFGGFILNEAVDVRQIGFALAVAIAVDAFVVRMTIVPAVLALVGERAWWLPRWLDRLLPNVDIEGTALEKNLNGERAQHAAVTPAQP